MYLLDWKSLQFLSDLDNTLEWIKESEYTEQFISEYVISNKLLIIEALNIINYIINEIIKKTFLQEPLHRLSVYEWEKENYLWNFCELSWFNVKYYNEKFLILILEVIYNDPKIVDLSKASPVYKKIIHNYIKIITKKIITYLLWNIKNLELDVTKLIELEQKEPH